MEKTKELKFLTHLGLTSAGPGAYEVRRCWRVGMILIGTIRNYRCIRFLVKRISAQRKNPVAGPCHN